MRRETPMTAERDQTNQSNCAEKWSRPTTRFVSVAVVRTERWLVVVGPDVLHFRLVEAEEARRRSRLDWKGACFVESIEWHGRIDRGTGQDYRREETVAPW